MSVNSTLEEREWKKYMEPMIDEFGTLLPVIHLKGVTEALAEREGMPILTVREIECLSMSADGTVPIPTSQPNWACPNIPCAATFKMARTKLGSSTLTQAVGKAVRGGIL